MSAGASFGIDSTSNRLAQVLAAGVAGLAIGSFVLSFNALRDVAEAAGIPGELAFAWPLIVDGFIVVATLAAFALRSRGLRVTWYPWATLIAFGIVSVIGNALHVQTLDPGRVRLDSTLAVAVSSVPPIALLVASHLLVVMISGHERTKGSRSAAVAPTPAQVTVSAPAAEPVAVSEPATQPIPVAARPATWPRLETVTVDDGRPAAASSRSVAMAARPATIAQPTGTEPADVAAAAEGGDESSSAARPSGAASDDLEAVAEHVRSGGEATGAAVAELLGVSDRTARRRLADARKRFPTAFEGVA